MFMVHECLFLIQIKNKQVSVLLSDSTVSSMQIYKCSKSFHCSSFISCSYTVKHFCYILFVWEVQ